MRRPDQLIAFRRRLPSWLALLALLIQFTASFGHIHPQDFLGLFHGTGTPTLTAGDGPSGPSNTAIPGDFDCPICAAAQLLGNSTLPDAVAPFVPGVTERAILAVLDELWLTPPDHLLFPTRGPPLV